MESSKPIYFYGCMQGVDGHKEAGHYWRTPDGHEPNRPDTPFGRYPDGTLCPDGPQAQGAAVLHQKNGWTAIGFWDRTGDSRGNSNSNFMVEGAYTFDEMCKLVEEAYPALWKRIGSVRLHSKNCPDIQGFHIKRVDDEHVEIKLHGHEIVSLSHDTNGWDGIGDAENIVIRIADVLKISVTKE